MANVRMVNASSGATVAQIVGAFGRETKPDLRHLVKAVMAIAMERQGLTPSWARPQLDALLSQRDSYGRM